MMGFNMVLWGPTIEFKVQPVDSSSQAIWVDLSAPPIGLDVSKKTPWALASAIITDDNNSDAVVYDQNGSVNDHGAPGGGVSACHLTSDHGDAPVLFSLTFNDPLWDGSSSPTPLFNVALVLQYTGYTAPVLPPNS